MKQNIALQDSLNFQNLAQRIYYKAHMLVAAATSSPAAKIRDARVAKAGKRAIPAYAGFTASPALTPVANTTGFAAGERFPGRPAVAAQAASGGYDAVVAISELPASPAFAVGVAVPAYPAVPARPAQLESAPVTAQAAITVPAVVAIKGYEDAVDIVVGETIDLSVEFPISGNVGLVGSDKVIIGEMTPVALQAAAWVDTLAGTAQPTTPLPAEIATETMEQSLYRDMVTAGATVVDDTRSVNGAIVNVKKVTMQLATGAGFDPMSSSLQLDKIILSGGGGGGPV